MSIIKEMARVVLETHFDAIEEDIVAQAKNRIMDTIGCMIGGANASGCQMLIDLVGEWGGKPECTIPVHGYKGPAQNVAMVNCVMCRSFDFEPVEPNVHGKNIPAHVSGTTVPTALALSELKNVGGREMITAVIVGDDMTSRVLAASRYSFDKGWDMTGTVNVFGATAIAGRLLGLDESQLVNAFGIALNQMAGSFQNIYDGTHCFKLPMGMAARAGIFSAELARKGFTGMKDPLLSKHGYYNLYGGEYDTEVLTKELGKTFFGDRTFKPYPSCRSTHAAIDCSLELVRGRRIHADDIEEITVNVTPATRDMFVSQSFDIGDFPQANATFSLRYNIANVFLRKSIKLEHFSEAFIRDPNIKTLASKVNITATLPPEKPLASGLEVRMRDGGTFSTYVEIPRGDGFYNALTQEELKQKFRENVFFTGLFTSEETENLIEWLTSLESIDDLGKLIQRTCK